MENNKPPRLAEMECGAAATFQRIRAAYRARKSPQRSPTRASCAALVNALFWKILVTRVKSFLWQANLLSCPGRSAARAISAFTRVFDALWRVVRCRHRSRVYPRSALKCAQVRQARLAWTVTPRFLAEMLQREHLLGVARRRWLA